MNNHSADIYPLDEAAIAAIAELRAQQHNAQMAINGVIWHFVKQQNISGEFLLAPNDKELILKPSAAAHDHV